MSQQVLILIPFPNHTKKCHSLKRSVFQLHSPPAWPLDLTRRTCHENSIGHSGNLRRSSKNNHENAEMSKNSLVKKNTLRTGKSLIGTSSISMAHVQRQSVDGCEIFHHQKDGWKS